MRIKSHDHLIMSLSSALAGRLCNLSYLRILVLQIWAFITFVTDIVAVEELILLALTRLLPEASRL